LVELIENFNGDDLRFGITTVQPNRAIKKCKIRNLRIEYFLNETAVILVTPKSCGVCERNNECTDDFVNQVLQKKHE
jgi:hypothetical protein